MVNYYDRLLVMQNGFIFAICYKKFIAGKLVYMQWIQWQEYDRLCNCFTISMEQEWQIIADDVQCVNNKKCTERKLLTHYTCCIRHATYLYGVRFAKRSWISDNRQFYYENSETPKNVIILFVSLESFEVDSYHVEIDFIKWFVSCVVDLLDFCSGRFI